MPTVNALHTHRAAMLDKLLDDWVIGVLEVVREESFDVVYLTLEASTITLRPKA
jgi:hypothetical protein